MRRTERLEIRVSEAGAVRGTLSYSADDRKVPIVIFAHGFGSVHNGEKSGALEAECERRGWTFAACDFRGHGASDGTMAELSGARLLEDLTAIVSALTDRRGGPVFLVGSSMGGWAAAWFAAREPERVRACALIAPSFRFPELRSLTDAERRELLGTGRLRFRNQFVDVEIGAGLLTGAKEYDPAALLVSYRTPAIILHGMKDEIVPHTDSLEFIAQCAATDVELHLFKGGDHRLNLAKGEIARLACEFFAARPG